MDKYANFDKLVQQEVEGKDYRVRVKQGNSGVVVAAPHGGGIEPGTSEIATAVAGKEHSLYAFEGIKQTGNFDLLHIKSENFDEPKGVETIGKSKTVLCLHGCDSNEDTVYIGGLDEYLKASIKKSLTQAGFTVSESPDFRLQGRSPKNICNRGQTGKGVQLEISEGLRKKMFISLTRKGRTQQTELFKEFVSALINGLSP